MEVGVVNSTNHPERMYKRSTKYLRVLAMLFLSSLCLLLCYPIIAQPNKIIEELTIGDVVPPVEMRNVLNYPSQVLRLEDFKGKLLIIDFWAIWCAPCVATLPKLQALQKKFGDKIKIITVTNEKKEVVNKFLLQNKIGKQIVTLPVICEDTLLSKYFRYISVPHEVWINPDGIVTAITTSQYVKEGNIQDILDGKQIYWPVKKEFSGFDLTVPLFSINKKGDNIPSAKPLFYSGFASYTDGISPGMHKQVDTINKSIRYNQFNLPILSLYSISLKGTYVFNNPKLCDLNVENRSLFVYAYEEGYKDTWVSNNYYTYEAVLPVSLPDSLIMQKLKNDLDIFFDLESKIEMKNMPCLILRKDDRLGTVPKSTKELPRHEITRSKTGEYQYMQKNSSLFYLAFTLNNHTWLNELPLVIDETGINYPIDLELQIGTSVQNIDDWKEQLNKYGLDLVPETRKVEVLVITEKKTKRI